jgi:acetyl esterase/lipase
MALIAASVFFPTRTFGQVNAVYAPTDLDKDPNLKIAPDQSGKPLLAWMTNAFHKCYLPDPIDRKGPTVSPCYTEAERFPDHLVFITCARDNLCVEAEELGAKIRAVPGKAVVHRRMEECDHAWNLKYKKGSVQERAKDEAYDLIVEALGARAAGE